MFGRWMSIGVGAAALWVMVAGVARADCGAVIAAFQKADAGGRFAWYQVSDVDQAPKGDPMMVSIGTTNYVPVGGSSRNKDKYQETGLLTGVLASSLKRRESNGQASCTPLAERTLRGERAVGFTVRGGNPLGNGNPPTEDVWIGRDTGLPIIQGMDKADHGGVVWVYGAAVSPPPPEKLLH